MSDRRVHYLACAPESYDTTVIYGVFDTWPDARDGVMSAEYISTSSEIQEWIDGEQIRTWTWQPWEKSWVSGWREDAERRY